MYPEFKIPADQLEAWQHDRAGAIVDVGLANKFGWKVGDRLNITGKIFPVNLELTIRGIFTPPDPTQSIYFNKDYIDEGFPKLKGSEGFLRGPGRFTRVRYPGGASHRRDVPQRRQSHQDRDRTRFPAGLHRDAGQHQGLHHEHLPGGGLYHPAGIGQHHGDVDSRAHAGSRGVEDAGLHPQQHSGIVRRRGGFAVRDGRAGGLTALLLHRERRWPARVECSPA